jgi:hypothetical protein
MPIKKHRPEPQAASPETPAERSGGRKAWKKKTPVEVFLDQEQKLRQEVERIEQELEQKRVQLRKFQEARKIFEAS